MVVLWALFSILIKHVKKKKKEKQLSLTLIFVSRCKSHHHERAGKTDLKQSPDGLDIAETSLYLKYGQPTFLVAPAYVNWLQQLLCYWDFCYTASRLRWPRS